MNAKVEEIAEKVRALPDAARDEFLDWLTEDELARFDEWDEKIARDTAPGGRLEPILQRARKDIAEGRTKPLDEVLNDI